jgi:hypothetical protein
MRAAMKRLRVAFDSTIAWTMSPGAPPQSASSCFASFGRHFQP